MVNDVCNMQLQSDVRSVQCKVQMKQRLFSQIASSSHVSHCTTFHAKIDHQGAEKSQPKISRKFTSYDFFFSLKLRTENENEGEKGKVKQK